jgi:hypothetical protein
MATPLLPTLVLLHPMLWQARTLELQRADWAEKDRILAAYAEVRLTMQTDPDINIE